MDESDKLRLRVHPGGIERCNYTTFCSWTPQHMIFVIDQT
jgi:hypothetical protein